LPGNRLAANTRKIVGVVYRGLGARKRATRMALRRIGRGRIAA
jgi:hypothetical protein